MSLYEGYQNSQGAIGDDYDAACGASINSPSCGAFVTRVINTYTTDQMKRKDNAVANVLYTANRVFDADKNSNYALIRSNDVNDMQKTLTDVNTADIKKVEHDVDLTRRQFEINEYHYHNKLDTLFFLQVFFIAVIVMVILMYFNRRGYLTTQMTGLLTAILAIVVVLIAVTRYFYTIRTRDRRLWHRRYFQSEREPSEKLLNVCPGPSTGEATINLNALFDKEDIQCAIDATSEYKKWLDATNKEAESQMKGLGNASSLFGGSFNKPDSCKRG
jgi:hypothetical protein